MVGVVRVVILDFDGVVLESNAVKTAAFADVFARFPKHAEAMMAYHHANVSASRFVKFDYLLTERLHRPHDTALRDELAADFSRRAQERLATVPFVAGAEAFLTEFSSRVPLYLASVTPADDLTETLERRALRHFFRGVYGCPPWTKPGAIRDILTLETCPSTAAVLVGDSNGDRRAADETGVEFVARDSGLTFDPPVPVTFRDLDAVAQYLRPRIS
jgi:phosphoglycolate phosphatase-like HAD superfamily hydrolase